MLVRHQWVREHGTPRVTTLTGHVDTGKRAWLDWLRLTGRSKARRFLFGAPARADASWLDRTATKLAAIVAADPRQPVAIALDGALLAGWLRARGDRLAALIEEGVVQVQATGRRAPAPRRTARVGGDARSVAEMTLFEALEATPSTAGRFALNQSIALQFGSRSAEIDL